MKFEIERYNFWTIEMTDYLKEVIKEVDIIENKEVMIKDDIDLRELHYGC